MLKNVVWVCAVLMLLTYSCKSVKKTYAEQKDNAVATAIATVEELVEKPREDRYYQMQKRGVDFFASGNEPFWNIEIGFDKRIKFSSLSGIDSLIVPVSDPILVMDAPMVSYKGSSTQGEVMVSIEQRECEDNMSGVKRPYVVRVSVKVAGDEKYREYVGCGEYYGNVRLHDIWALQSLNGTPVNSIEFSDHPYMELHLNNSRVMGFLGCNSFSSDFFMGRNQIFFSYIKSTKMACPSFNFEEKFSKAISNKLLNYRFDGLQLILENYTDTLVFKKVD